MAITARGAWESVKRHFRELGKDIQRQPVTVVGVGDMSGDVFGNGMLLSKTLKLRAAFDHRHIFLDPDPDPASAWTERRRLFDLPRSSWDDYDRARISIGGGVWPRTLKSVPLSPEARALLEVKAHELSPDELIETILRSRTELLYLGGIGTYVKAVTQSNVDVGDKANDAVRVNGSDLRCLVVGEGANLGFTQAGRIEFALKGGRIDTDAIDNSAGVDTSDHEVNIKILTGLAIRARALAPSDRDPLLASMTDEVAGHVLEHNYDQSLALSMLEAEASGDLEGQAAFMTALEKRGRLDRALEVLPDAATLGERATAGKGLTRPELAVLLAYGKIDLFDDIIASSAPDDPALATTLRDYFPKGPVAVPRRDGPPPSRPGNHRHGGWEHGGQSVRADLRRTPARRRRMRHPRLGRRVRIGPSGAGIPGCLAHRRAAGREGAGGGADRPGSTNWPISCAARPIGSPAARGASLSASRLCSRGMGPPSRRSSPSCPRCCRRSSGGPPCGGPMAGPRSARQKPSPTRSR